MRGQLAQWIIFAVADLAVAAAFALQPYLLAKAVLFGVFVPEKDRTLPEVSRLRGTYAVLVAAVMLILAGLGTAVIHEGQWNEDLVLPIILGLQMLAAILAYWAFRRLALKLKTERGWEMAERLSDKRVASLDFRRKRLTVSSLWFIPHLIVIAVCSAAAWLNWDTIPEEIGVHFNAAGIADRMTAKTFGSVFSLNLTQLFLVGLFILLNRIIYASRQQLDPEKPDESLEKQLKLRRSGSLFLCGLSFVVVAIPGLAQGSTLYGWDRGAIPLVLTAMPLIILACTALLVVYATRNNMGPGEDALFKDDRLWRAGIFYFNKLDSSLFVAKRTGIGWTINFANPLSWLLLAAIVVIPLLISLIGG